LAAAANTRTAVAAMDDAAQGVTGDTATGTAPAAALEALPRDARGIMGAPAAGLVECAAGSAPGTVESTAAPGAEANTGVPEPEAASLALPTASPRTSVGTARSGTVGESSVQGPAAMGPDSQLPVPTPAGGRPSPLPRHDPQLAARVEGVVAAMGILIDLIGQVRTCACAYRYHGSYYEALLTQHCIYYYKCFVCMNWGLLVGLRLKPARHVKPAPI
jgi:hypothetical protein